MGNNGCSGQGHYTQSLVYVLAHTNAVAPLGSPMESAIECGGVSTSSSHGAAEQAQLKSQWLPKGGLESRKQKASCEIDMFINQLQQENNASTKILVESRKQTVYTKQATSGVVSRPHCKKAAPDTSSLQDPQLQPPPSKWKVSKMHKCKQIPDEIQKDNPLHPSSKLNRPLMPYSQKKPTLIGKSVGAILTLDNPLQAATESREDQSCVGSDVANLQQLVLSLERLQSSPRSVVQLPAPNFFGDLDPISYLCTESSSGSACDHLQGSVILQVEVVIGDKSEKIMVKQGDTIEQLSGRFLRENGLPPELKGGLVHAIQQRICLE